VPHHIDNDNDNDNDRDACSAFDEDDAVSSV
jgi:hypothetical protein